MVKCHIICLYRARVNGPELGRTVPYKENSPNMPTKASPVRGIWGEHTHLGETLTTPTVTFPKLIRR